MMYELEQARRYIATIVVYLAITVGGAPAVMASECPPSAVVEGAPTLIEPIRELLEARGVRRETPPGCPVVRAAVAENDAMLTVEIEDGSGRLSQRTVSSTETAAALIESWARDDLSSPFLEPRVVDEPLPDEGEARAQPTPEKLASAESEQEVSPRGAGTALRVLLDGEATASWDGGTWFGGKAGIGFGLGRIIIGGVFRFSIDTKLTGPGRRYDTHRVAFDGLAFIGIPIKWSRVALIPGVDIGGGGVRRYERVENATTTTDDDILVNETNGGARLSGHLSLDIPLKGGFGLNIDLSFCVSLPAERDVITREGYPLAGEPLGNTRLGFGVRYDYPLGRKRRGT